MAVSILDKKKYWKTCECEHCGSLLGFEQHDTFCDPPIDTSGGFDDILTRITSGNHKQYVSCPNCHKNTRVFRDEKVIL